MIEIAIHQIKSGSRNLLFVIMLSLILLSFTVNAFVYSSSYADDFSDWKIATMQAKRALDNSSSQLLNMANTVHDVIKPPSALTFITDSDGSKLPNVFSVTAFRIGEPKYIKRGNNLHFSFASIDWAFIIGTLMSLTAVLISFDSICGEKQNGTLRLVLSNSISRLQLFAGKYVGLFMVLVSSLFLGVIANLTIIYFLGEIPIHSGILQIIGLDLLISILYLSFVLVTGMAVSSMVAKPSVAMITLLVIWATIVFAIPGVSRIIGKQEMAVKSSYEIEKEIQASRKNIEDNAPAPGVHGTRRGASNMAERSSVVDAILTAENKIRHSALQIQLAQAQSVNMFSSLSPTMLLRNTFEAIGNSGLAGFSDFYETVNLYKRRLLTFVKEEDKKDPKSPHFVVSFGKYTDPGLFSLLPIEFSSIPSWEELWREGGIHEEFPLPLIQIVWLLALNLQVAIVAFILLNRYDPR